MSYRFWKQFGPEVNLSYQSSLLKHPTRHQNFANTLQPHCAHYLTLRHMNIYNISISQTDISFLATASCMHVKRLAPLCWHSTILGASCKGPAQLPYKEHNSFCYRYIIILHTYIRYVWFSLYITISYLQPCVDIQHSSVQAAKVHQPHYHDHRCLTKSKSYWRPSLHCAACIVHIICIQAECQKGLVK